MLPETLALSPPSFKHGEIKSLLTERVKSLHPSFRFLTAATGVYHFQRLKEFRDYHLREALHFVFSPGDSCMHVSVSSRLNPLYTLTPVYNNGFINPHVDLVAIIKTGDIFPSANTAYFHDGTIDGIKPAIDQAVRDFGCHGLAYLEQRWTNLRSNALVHTGMDIIDTWEFDRTMLRNELNLQFKKARLSVTNLRHPICNRLKGQLHAVQGQPSNYYQEIPRLAFELMELYCNSRIIS